MRSIAAILLFGLLLTACGQRPGVYQPLAAGDSTSAGSIGAVDGVDDGAVDGGDAAGAAAGTGGRAASGPGRSATGAATGPAALTGKIGQEAVKEWGDEIVIGIHVPVTGAASLKASAFDAGKDLYWKFLEKQGKKVHGRKVSVVFYDDQYRPSTAAQVCKQMVQGDKAFLLVGAAGTDQIVECARFAASQGVPYLSAGVTEKVLSNLPNYSALSMTYPAQGPLLAGHLKELESTDGVRQGTSQNDPVMRVGLIYSNTPNFADAAESFQDAFKEQSGRNVDYVKVVSKNPSAQEAAQQAQALATWPSANAPQGVDIVYILSSVTFVVNLANSLPQSYRPRFVGVGITMVNQGVDLMCVKNEFQGARYFSPFPAWADRNSLDPDFDKAVEQQAKGRENTPNGGELMWTVWTLSRVLHAALEHAGPQLSRTGFIKAMESFKYSERKAYADLSYGAGQRFGAKSAHLLEARCQQQQDSRGQFFTHRKAW